MDISQVAKASGLPASTIRYYEEKGLIHSTGRKGLRRQFHPKVVERLSLISLGVDAGFSLEEIGTMFTPEGPAIDRTLLLAKADQLDKKIKELKMMRDGLRHAAQCSAASHLECPNFLRILRLTNKKARRPSNKLKDNH